MLERLESEILSLQSRNLELQTSLRHFESNGASGASVKTSKGPAKKKRLKPSAKKASKRARPPHQAEQLELPVASDTPAGEQPARTVGKRQALGKSLLQLRKMSTLRSH